MIDVKLKEARKEINLAKRTDRVCTKANPMPLPYTKDMGRWSHDDVHETDADSDYYLEYECRSCGHVWRTEMPD